MKQEAYRPDIDGLRAVAVLSVLLFHVDLWFTPGGFVGVDVIFVISGYLISSRIFDGLRRGDLRVGRFLADFYERRARRILPAYLVVSAATAVAAYFILMPQQFAEFGWSLAASSLLSANIYFWSVANYFGPDAAEQPLLHYWSLGVEEHFYVVFPLVAFVVWRVAQKALFATIVILLFLSLAAAEWMVGRAITIAFYWLPFRAWELLAGSILAAMPMRPRWPLLGAMMSASGLVAIIASVALFEETMRFPGLTAIFPVAGSMLLIWGGLRKNAISRLMGNAALNYIGRISYSLYLVHWPIIVFARKLFPYSAPGILVPAVLAASFGLAALSYHFVETPVRDRRGWWSNGKVWSLSAVGIAVSLAIGIAVLALKGMPWRLPNDVQKLLAFDYGKSRQGLYRERECFLQPDQAAKDLKPYCLPTGGNVALLWGDSYAAHFTPGLMNALSERGYTFAQATASLCPPLLGRSVASRPKCQEFNDFVIRWSANNRPKLVILSGYWPPDRPTLDILAETLKALRQAGIPAVVLGPGPDYRERVPVLMATRLFYGDLSEFSDRDLNLRYAWVGPYIEKVVVDNGATYIPVIETVCGDVEHCPMMKGQVPFHIDRGHMTKEGSEYFVSKLLPDILAAAHHK